eukprot:376504_1
MATTESSETSNFVDITPEERAKQLNDLEMKLNQLEDEIIEQERQIDTQKTQSKKHKLCSCAYLSTADIKSDIPGKFQRYVYYMHYLWIFNSLTLIMNWIVIVVLYGFGTASHFIVPTIFVLAGIPGGYYGWYRKFFAAIASRSQTYFMIFNVNFTIHLIFVAIMCTGFVTLNSAGVLLMIKQIINKHSAFYKILVVITTSMWCIDLIATLMLFRKSFKLNAMVQYGKLLIKDPKLEIAVKDQAKK